MITSDVTILADSDEPFAMSILGAMAEKKLIQINAATSIVRPGFPLSVVQLNQQIDQSERSGRVSVEDAKTRLGL